MSNTIFFLSNYNWESGTLLKSKSIKNFKIKNNNGYILYVAKEKCASFGEKVCIVWETWKGKNGRGGYRVERRLYSEHRITAENIFRQHTRIDKSGRVTESSIGILV